MPVLYRTVSATALAALVIAASLAGGPLRGAAQPVASSPVTISIIGTNDVHGGVLPTAGRGGLPLLAGYVNNLRDARARDGGAVLLIDAGDMWQGTLESNLSEGASVVSAYNALGYTAAALGNHEFDFGPVGPAAIPATPADNPRGALLARAAEARFPFLAANLIDEATGRPVVWPNVRPSVAVEAGGVIVGVIGVMTADAATQTIAANIRGLRIDPLAASIAREAGALRKNGAAAVVVASHAGGECKRFDNPADLSSCDQAAEIFAVARALPPGLVDVIVSGHVHQGMAHEVNGVALVSAYTGGVAFDRVDLRVDRQSRRVVSRHIHPPHQICEREDAATATCEPTVSTRGRVPSRYEGKRVVADRRITAVLEPAVRQAAQLKAKPLGVVLDTAITRTGVIESALGNLFVDALRESIAGADVGLHNIRGGIRADLPRGPLTYGGVFAIMPFDNRVVMLQLTGAELKRVLAGQLQTAAPRAGISGIRVQAACTSGALTLTLQRASGAPIRDDERLSIATTDFVALGGNDILTVVTPAGGFPIPDHGPMARDLIADWFTKRGGRVRAEQFEDAVRPRWTYPGTLPVTCRGGP